MGIGYSELSIIFLLELPFDFLLDELPFDFLLDELPFDFLLDDLDDLVELPFDFLRELPFDFLLDDLDEVDELLFDFLITAVGLIDNKGGARGDILAGRGVTNATNSRFLASNTHNSRNPVKLGSGLKILFGLNCNKSIV